MKRLKLDAAPPSVKKFVRGLHPDMDGVELEIDGDVVCKVIPPQVLTEGEKQALLDRFQRRLRQVDKRVKNVPASVLEHEIRQAVSVARQGK